MLTTDLSKLKEMKVAPSKETLSFRAYSARRRMTRLRRAACRMYQSEEMITIFRRLEIEIESRRLAVRRDRMLHVDIGLKVFLFHCMILELYLLETTKFRSFKCNF